MKQQFILMSEYNQWMNESLLSHLNEGVDLDIYEEKGAFWGSAFKTMSHIFTCDLMWLHRFTNVQSSYDLNESLNEFPHPTSISTHCFETLDELRASRGKLDAVIADWISSISDTEFDSNVVYQNSSGKEFSEPFASVLLHFFNHQTHHRGQVTTLISQSGDNSYCTDLLGLIRK
ncbi:damage-inducible protein DinB [Vibrio neptunius]|uniref:DinB family protein n=1 Tax=Vibrio neptunius TaxID=170651 RepID=UPI0005FA6556|nr:DinB family protein [Vibrio neptunius]KJY93777.1 damage-inducible protein DinB [Vibrio neptunius]